VPHERWEDRVHDILTAIEKIQRYTAGFSFEAFANDEKTVDAVVRNLTIIGEAAQHIPTDIQARIPAIPWTVPERVPTDPSVPPGQTQPSTLPAAPRRMKNVASAWWEAVRGV
jgi:hypothetical protein